MHLKPVVTVVWVFAVHLSRSATDDGGRTIAGPAVDAVMGVIQTVSGLGRPDGSAAAVETQETTSKPCTSAHRPEVTTGSCSAPEPDYAVQLAEFNQATDQLGDEPQSYSCSRYVEEFCN